MQRMNKLQASTSPITRLPIHSSGLSFCLQHKIGPAIKNVFAIRHTTNTFIMTSFPTLMVCLIVPVVSFLPPILLHSPYVTRTLFNMLDIYSKKISLTFFPNASAILESVFVDVSLILPLSKPEIIVLDTLDLAASASCDIPISSLISLTLYCNIASPRFCLICLTNKV